MKEQQPYPSSSEEDLEPAEKPKILTSLSELSVLLPSTPAEKPWQDAYHNTYRLVSLMMYLIGVEEKHFHTFTPALTEEYQKYNSDSRARIIRNLCRVRTALEQNFGRIREAFLYDLKNLSTLPDYIPVQAVTELAQDGVSLQKSRPDIIQYIIAINREISNRITGIRTLFPDWIKWDYIQSLFLMPNGFRPEGVKAAGSFYNTNRSRYPYQCYMNWDSEGHGSMFYSDRKFVTALYERHEDQFEDMSLVTDAGDVLLADLNEFIRNHERILMVVDCENSDPIKLAAAMMNLPISQKEKIHRIVLFDSEYTSPIWNTLCNTGITKSYPTEHVVVGRLYEHKSLVDMTLAIETCRGVYQENVDSVILVSSDSDYWALIQALPDVDFLVMLEKMKSGKTITSALEGKGYCYCYIDDFCTGTAYAMKTQTIISLLQEQLDSIVDFNIREMLDDVVSASWLEISEKEKQNFYDKHLKAMRLKLENDGSARLLID